MVWEGRTSVAMATKANIARLWFLHNEEYLQIEIAPAGFECASTPGGNSLTAA